MDIIPLLIIILIPLILGLITLFFWRLQKDRQNGTFWRILTLSALILCALSFSFALLESYYRWFHESTDAFGLSKTTENWFIKHYQPNSMGMRDDREYRLHPPESKQRLTFLGDSFTAGHGIENISDRFANRIRRQRNNWNVHVLARNGFDTEHQIQLLENILPKGYKLDQVILIYVLNDISELVPEWQNILASIYHDRDNENFLIRNSYFLNFIYYRLKSSSSPHLTDYYNFVRKAYLDPDLWGKQKSRLTTLKKLVEDHGGTLSVVTFPFLHKLDENYEYVEIHKELDRFWKEQNIAHLDLYPTFRDYPSKDIMVNARDPHPNELAHQLAAEEISRFISGKKV